MNELKTSIKLDAKQAEAALESLVKRMNRLSETSKKMDNQYNGISSALNDRLQKELAIERAVKQQLNVMTEADRAAQRMRDTARERNRQEYENWWATQLVAREQEQIARKIAEQRAQYQKLHPIQYRIQNAWEQIKNKTSQVVSSNRVLSSIYNRSKSLVTGIVSGVRSWWANQKMVHSSVSSTNAMLSATLSRIKAIAATYLGIMGTKAVINTSDIMTSAENKLNYTSATALGDKGYNANGGYSVQTIQATQSALDKMYASSQKVRISYTDMMTNVSKTMALAGDAFQNNTDNAIRFQEIMAEAYAVGGASAAEMSSSMYQLTQALGAGVLAGDELRSVREGAPLAYKAIEEFAQGVYDTTDSLKDMASEGKISSDMVVAAIMNAGDKMDNAFAQTAQTFDQTWKQIVGAAQYAFLPVSKMLRTMLNDAIDNGLISKVESFMVVISKMVQIIVKGIGIVVNWIIENWSWLQDVLVAGITTLLILMTYAAIQSAITWLITNWAILLVAAAIFAVIYSLMQLQQGTINTCQVILAVIAIIVSGLLVLSIAFHSMILFEVALVVALLGVIFMFFEEVCGGAMWLLAALWNIASYITSFVCAAVLSILAFIQNIIAFIVNLVVACASSIVAISHNAVAGIINVAVSLWNSLNAIAQNIGIAFQNAWIWASNTFWEFVADVLSGVSKLEPVINGIAKLIGKDGVDFGGAISSARSRKSDYKSFVNVGSAWSSGMDTISYKSISDGWSKGWNTMNYANIGNAWSKGWNMSNRKDLSTAYDTGYNWGAGIKSNINNWGSNLINSFSKKLGGGLNLDEIGKKLGLNFSGLNGIANNNPNGYVPVSDLNRGGGLGSGFPNSKNPYYGTGSSYKQPSVKDLIGDVGKIGKDTSKIADSMELSEEDLEYLRKAAELEWKKEYTVAEITVDMTNHNTVNGDSDLDGIVTKLTDRLYEELAAVADGVYA